MSLIDEIKRDRESGTPFAIMRIPKMEAALLAAEELAVAVVHERNMVCQDVGMQIELATRVDAALAAYRSAIGGE